LKVKSEKKLNFKKYLRKWLEETYIDGLHNAAGLTKFFLMEKEKISGDTRISKEVKKIWDSGH